MAKVLLETSEIYDAEEAAKILNRGVATIWRWIKSGKIKVLRVSGRTLIPSTEIQRLREQHGK